MTPDEDKKKKIEKKLTKEEVIKITKKEYNKLKSESAEYLDGWKRAKADFINFKKENEKKQKEYTKFSNEVIIIQILPIYDHLKTAFQNIDNDIAENAWVDGIKKIKQEMQKFLQDNGIEEIKTLGERFDPSMHESVGKETDENSKPETILKQVKFGYKLHGKVIIPAQVIINKTKAE